MSSLANSGSGKIDVDALLGLLEDAEKLDMAKTYQAQQIEKLQFHLVQFSWFIQPRTSELTYPIPLLNELFRLHHSPLMTGLCGRAVIVPGERDIDDLLSAFPIQPSSVPSLSINGRKYLEDTHLSTAAQIQTEQEAIPPVRRICAQTWPSTPGPTLQTYNVRPASSSLGRIPAPDFLVSGQWIIVEELDKTSEGRELTILEKPSTTLSQYARGKTGAVKPFAPGGVDLEPNSSDILGSKSGFQKTDQETSYLTLEAIEKSLVVLGEWTDDDLISAPPGLHRGLTRADFEPKVEVNMEPSNEQGISTESVVGLVEKIERKREVAPISRPLAGKLDLAAIFQGSDTSSDAYTSSEDESEAEPTETTELSPPEMVPDLGSLNIPFVETLEGIEEDEERLLDTLLGIPTGEAGGTISLKHREMISHLLHKGREENRESWAITSLLDVSDFRSLVPNPAIEYPFELDGFQKQAVARLERRECVFVAAHTSAGKTVVAEYAIALAAAHMTRAIYTSPIKALSNQKYRDFKKRFGEDVGLITGDVSINPEASCLIMTTEILRSMLYRGADLVRDIEWVIFDEVHYINDTERGVVWEEVIIMLPEHAGMIFLSATTPNTIEFSDWIGRTKKKPVHVITTDYRPVPLQHFIYAGNEMHKVMDHHKTFLPAGHAAAAAILAPKEEKKTTPSQPGGRGRGTADSTRGGARGGGRAPVQKFGARSENRHDSMGKKSQWQALASRLVKDGLTPTVIFSFSKKKCEDCADALSSGDYTDAVEKSMVHTVCMSTINRLDPDDARLPQVKRIQQMLKRGVGVHHGGLLPILKETVEILFSRGAVKFLFATETFAMGVNMPARTVVFNGFRKHDGREFRDLLPGEYTQMAGRAGRRGLDKIGTVLLTAWSEPPQLPSLRTMLTGSATKLESQFRLKYNMILNLLRVEVMSVEGMIKRSFSEFATQRALGAHNLPKFLQRAESALAKLDKKAEVESNGNASASVVAEYLKYSEEACAIQASMLTYAFMNARGGKSLLGPGRLLVVTTRKFVNAPAMVLRPPLGGGEAPPPSLGGTPKLDFNTDIGSILVLVLCPEGFIIPEKEKSNLNIENVDEISGGGFSKMKKRLDPFADLTWKSGGSSLGKEPLLKAGEYGLGGGRAYMIVELDLHGIVSVGKKRASVDIDVLLYKAEKNVVDSAIKALVEVDRTLLGQGISGEFSDLDIVRELKITEMEMVELANQFRTLTTMKSSLNCEAIPNFRDKYLMEAKRSRLWSKIQQVKAATSNERLQLFPDFQQRLGVLHALGYVDEVGDTVQLKGRVACEVNTADELIVTEIVFENVLQHLDPPEIAGILSALVFQEKSDNEPPLTPRLQEARVKVDRIARSLGALQASHGLPTGPEDFAVKNLNFGVVDVVYDWARGVPFAEICEITLVQEGTIVRTITRLDELLREVRNAARVVGDPTLYRKMEATSQLIRRGVIFCASLYV